MNGPSPPEEAGDGASIALATVEESWAHEQTPSESGSGEQRQKVLGVSAGPCPCPCGGKGKAGVDAHMLRRARQYATPGHKRMVDSQTRPPPLPLLFCCFSPLSRPLPGK